MESHGSPGDQDIIYMKDQEENTFGHIFLYMFVFSLMPIICLDTSYELELLIYHVIDLFVLSERTMERGIKQTKTMRR